MFLAFDQARQTIEVRSLSFPHDRTILLNGLHALRDELVGAPPKESNGKSANEV